MRKETFEQLKKEMLMIIGMFIIILIGVSIAFYNENFTGDLMMVLALFWLLILPGFSLMLYWHEELKFHERFVIGIGVGTAAVGISSYYIGLAGFHIKYHHIFIPIVLILIGVLVFYFEERKK